MGTMEKTLIKVKQDNVKFIELQFSDFLGGLKSITIPTERLPEALEKGIWFDGSSIEGFARIAESDMYLKPDINTYALIPWHDRPEKTARLICDIYGPDGNPFEGDPRYILKKVLKEAEELGFKYYTGPEPEFFIFRKDNGNLKALPHDKAGYFDLTTDLAAEIRKDMVLALEKMGIEVEASHHEVAIGQHEIDFKYAEALKTADNVVTFKFTVKAIAQKHDLHATFMPKPIFGINGSGMHVHQSLFKDNKNIFYDETDKYKLSQIAKSFIAGQLQHIKSICSITSPLVNSYKRLTPGYEAPVYICWGQINRSALIRIPRIHEGKSESARCEIRCPDPTCNPYLAFAVLLKAGLEGIKQNLKLEAPVEEDVYHFDDKKLEEKNIDVLPYSLWEAIKYLKKDDMLKSFLGEETWSKYIEAKTKEWDDYRISVSEWEINRYLENT